MAQVVPESDRLSIDEINQLPRLKHSDDAVEIRLSGVAKMPDGELARHNFFRELAQDLDDYSDISYTPEEARKVKGQFAVYKTGGSAALPRICNGEGCGLKGTCVFYQQKHLPLGRRCLIELNLLKDWRMRYFDEYEVDIYSPTDISYINELAETDLLLWRVNHALAQPEHVDLLIDNPVGVDADGAPIFQKQVSPVLEVRDRLEARRSRIIKLMVGDRQEKYKRDAALKQRDTRDTSQQQSEIKKHLDEIRRALQAAKLGVDSQNAVEKALEEGPGANVIIPEVVSPEDILEGRV